MTWNDYDAIHHGHTPEIELLSTTEATGIRAMEDRLTFPDGTRRNHPGSIVRLR